MLEIIERESVVEWFKAIIKNVIMMNYPVIVSLRLMDNFITIIIDII